MPKKISFLVIYTSSEDPKFRSSELNSHGPTIKGWQSDKNCLYPQEIILQLDKRCLLCRIQILTHQYLISKKIELFSSNDDTNISNDDISKIKWNYLGFITLSDNENSEYESRELKSVNVPKNLSSFIKLKLSENYINIHNIYNQISLIAINVLGKEIENRAGNSDPLTDIIDDPDYLSPYDDLAFEMYVDVEIAKIIRDMEVKKHLAVINERFEYAKKLKDAMENLRIFGEKLGKYELEKRHAIELEDYEKAKHKKNQIDELKTKIYQDLNINQLLESKCPKNDESHDDNSKNLLSPTFSRVINNDNTNSSNQGSPIPFLRQSPNKGSSPCNGSPTNIAPRNSFRRRNKSAGAIVKSTYEMYEEKPLPALRHSQTNEFLRDCQLENEHKTTSKLSERERKQAALPILVFGSDLVEKFYSKHYLDKEEGLKLLKEEFLSYNNTRMHTPNKTARAAIFLLHRTLRDKVFTIYNLANEVIRLFFVQFVPTRVSPAEVSRSVDKLLPELLTKSGDTSARIHHIAVHTILTMADCKNVRDLHIIPVHLTRPVSSSTHPRLALSRAEMVEQLIINHGISTEKQSGLTCRTLAEFGSSGLHHPAEAVRKVSERILVLVYKVNARLVRKQLPPDDDITRRNLLYRQLFHEFDKIDILRKKEMLEKSKQCFSSPENLPSEMNKCASTSNFQQIFESNNTQTIKNNSIKKSLSGNNINNNNNKNGIMEKESSSSASGISTPSNNSGKEEDEKQCIFCNQQEVNILTMNNSMNSHYWRSCPMLVRCKECNQVVEVSALFEHLLIDCDHKFKYTQCLHCTEAILKFDMEKHKTKNCIKLKENCKRCPLCHKDLENEELCWKKHLMGCDNNSCSKNTRTKYYNINKQVKIKL